MELPVSRILPTQFLSISLKETTTSYKYLWLWSLLKHIASNKENIVSVEKIISGMLALSVRPLIEFKLSFGITDRLKDALDQLQQHNTHTSEISANELLKYIEDPSKQNEHREIFTKIARYVPFRFLAPWFDQELTGIIDSKKNIIIAKCASRYFFDKEKIPLYRFINDFKTIEINDTWREYFQNNYTILEGFILWHFTNYLSKNNPNVPNIQDKLKAEHVRNLAEGRKFWDLYLHEMPLKCIYSDQLVQPNNYSLDHFLPWSYCTHDYLWNLIPTSKEINSAKSDRIPSTKVYLNKFITAHFNAVRIISSLKRRQRILEDHMIFLNNNIENIIQMDEILFNDEYRKRILPHIQIASNMGFRTEFIFKKKS